MWTNAWHHVNMATRQTRMDVKHVTVNHQTTQLILQLIHVTGFPVRMGGHVWQQNQIHRNHPVSALQATRANIVRRKTNPGKSVQMWTNAWHHVNMATIQTRMDVKHVTVKHQTTQLILPLIHVRRFNVRMGGHVWRQNQIHRNHPVSALQATRANIVRRKTNPGKSVQMWTNAWHHVNMATIQTRMDVKHVTVKHQTQWQMRRKKGGKCATTGADPPTPLCDCAMGRYCDIMTYAERLPK